jgi:hypothetical protein
MAGGARLGPREISEMLAHSAEAVARYLLPNGRKGGRWWEVGSLAGEKGQSLRVTLSGGKRGRWKDYTSEEYGDLLDLFTHCRGGGDSSRGLKEARVWLGLGDDGGRNPTPEELRRTKERSERRRAELEAQARREAEVNHRRAVAMWEKARALTAGDAVDRYLKYRAVDLGRLGRAPAALRYAPSLWAAAGRHCPAMLGVITNHDGEPISVHRTFLAVRPDGVVTKAETETGGPVKSTLGAYAGHSIKLWRGRSGKPWAQMPDNETVVVSEGVEDALSFLVDVEVELGGERRSVVVAASELRIIAAVSGGNMLALELPRRVSRVIILEQRDPPDSSAANMLGRAIDRFQAQGREVLLLPPPAWPQMKDHNNLAQALRRTQSAAVRYT